MTVHTSDQVTNVEQSFSPQIRPPTSPTQAFADYCLSLTMSGRNSASVEHQGVHVPCGPRCSAWLQANAQYPGLMAAASDGLLHDLCADGVRLRASSVLNGKKKDYGPNHVLDADPSSCWNSDQGLPQWLEIELGSDEERSSASGWEPRIFTTMKACFQGGFTGTRVRVLASLAARRKDAEWHCVGTASFADSSSEQVVDVERMLRLHRMDHAADVAAAQEAGVVIPVPEHLEIPDAVPERRPSDTAAACTAATSDAADVAADATCNVACRRLRLEFIESSDFFGRVTIYQLALLGGARAS